MFAKILCILAEGRGIQHRTNLPRPSWQTGEREASLLASVIKLSDYGAGKTCVYMEGNNTSLYTGYICSHGSLPMSSTINFPFPRFFCFPWTFLIPLLCLWYECQSTPRADSGVQKPTRRTTEKEEFLRSPNAVFFLVDSYTIPLGISRLIDSYEVKQLGFLGSHLDLLAAHAWFCSGSKQADKGNGCYQIGDRSASQLTIASTQTVPSDKRPSVRFVPQNLNSSMIQLSFILSPV